jgi:hypothetical protein
MRLLSFLLISLFASTAMAETFYRYVDDTGETVINNYIPADKAKLGYDVINDKGRVLETVPRQLTTEELAARSQEQINAAKEKEAKERQNEYDLNLLRKYSFVSDIEAEKERKIREMTVRATILKGNLYGVRSELEIEYENAAQAEKQGKSIAKKTRDRIEALESKITTTEELLVKREEDIEKTRKEYLYAIERFKQLQALKQGAR